ncbi:MAG: hypothetical protein ACR2JQ_10090, partial [Mycobacteriales bacterium]
MLLQAMSKHQDGTQRAATVVLIPGVDRRRVVQDRRPAPGALEPIERASVDELRALQARRLRWSVRHAYDNVPHYRR